MPVPGPLQTVQRAEFLGAILALQAVWPGHLGIDILNVVRSVGRLLDRGSLSKPLPLVKDGDLVAIVQHMIHARGQDTVRVTKVKGMLLRLMLIRVLLGMRISSAMPRRALLNAGEFWHPIVFQLH